MNVKRKSILLLIIFGLISSPVLAKNEGKYNKHKQLPPGLEKKYERTGELPPGWQKKLVKGEVLDDELYEIGVRLPGIPKGYNMKPRPGTEILQIENRIIRIKKDTKEILDILGIKFD